MFKNIVIPVDLSDKEPMTAVLPIVINYANSFGAKLYFVHIIPDFGMKMVEDYLPKHWLKEQEDKYSQQIKELILQHVPKGIMVDFHIGRGTIYDQVIQYSSDIQADLIILSAVRPQLRDYMLGSNASKIVRHASISVLVVRD